MLHGMAEDSTQLRVGIDFHEGSFIPDQVGDRLLQAGRRSGPGNTSCGLFPSFVRRGEGR